jgi:hypothetical protein
VVECVDVLESERGGRESEARRDQADRLRRRLVDCYKALGDAFADHGLVGTSQKQSTEIHSLILQE